jgi:aminopeptidase N
MDSEDLREAMKPYGRKLVAEQLARLGMKPKENDTHFDHLLRPTILGIASISEEKQVVDTMLQWFKDMETSEDIAPDLRGVTYTTAARHGDAATFDKLVHLHNTSPSPEERVTLAAAITAFKQPELVQRALSMITSDDVRLQDVAYWIAYSLGNRHARTATWQWLQENWQWLKDNLGADTSFTRMPVYVARVTSHSDFLPEYKQFFESVMEPSIDRAYKQGMEMIEWQSAWRDRDLKAIQDYFTAS